MEVYTFETKYQKEGIQVRMYQEKSYIAIKTEKLGTRQFTLSSGTWSFWEGYDSVYKRNRLIVRRVS